MPLSRANHTPLTPLDLLARSARAFRDRPAVHYGEKSFTYGEFDARVDALARALRDAGVGEGDRVAALTPNIPPLLEAHFGVPKLGALLVAINTRLAPAEVKYILEHSGAKVLIVDTELAPPLKDILGTVPNLTTVVHVSDAAAKGPTWIPAGPEYEAFLAAAKADPVSFVLTDENAPISINYTSGTTGNPKGVVYTHRGACLNAYGEIMATALNPTSVYLWTLPMFHCNGWCFPWAVTGAGAAHVCLRYVDPDLFYKEIDRRGLTHMCGAPVVLRAIAAKAPTAGYRFAKPVQIVTAGAPPSPTLIAQMEEMGSKITHVYGLTEVYGPFTFCDWQPEWDGFDGEERARYKARQGIPYVQAGEVRVVNEEMVDVPADGQTMGEVILRGNGVMLEYYQNPAATEESFRGGWFHTGDIAVMHPNTYIELKDRAKDIIISGGENISTIEVENMIYQHPAVLEAAVIAAPDDRWGEVPKAFITLKPGADVAAEEIIDFCRARMAKFKCPKAIEFVELPKTSTGKIRKNVLREKEWAGIENRIRG